MDTNHLWQGNMTISIPAKWHYASGTFALLCLVCGLISNISVIVMFLQWVRRSHTDICLRDILSRNSILRRPKNYFIINLAICDIGLLLTNNSMHVIASYKTEWPFRQLGNRRSSVVTERLFLGWKWPWERNFRRAVDILIVCFLGCNLYSVCGGIFGLSSIATMATIALVRVVAVLTPFNSLKMNRSFIMSMCFDLFPALEHSCCCSIG